MADDERRPSVFDPMNWAMSVPTMLLRNGTPDTVAHHVLLVMATFADPDGTNIRPGLAKLTKRSHLTTQRAASEAVKRLEAAGLIIRSGEFNGTVVWRLNFSLCFAEGDDLSELRFERARKANAERQRRYRAKKKNEGG